MSADRLRLRVVTPLRVALEIEADQVEIPGALGTIGVLPGHAPLLASLRTGELSYRVDRQFGYIAVFGGFVEIADNLITVLADGAELANEIDLSQAENDKTCAEDTMRTQGGETLDQARRQLEAAVTRIVVASRK
jgi:F-type H+-transporting ATPase subunit epsilon